jgi:hypothetical protein
MTVGTLKEVAVPGCQPAPKARFRRYLAVIAVTVLLCACGNQAENVQSLGDAYAGAATVPLYAELEASPAVNAELHFGDEVKLLQRRRNFYYVRGPEGKQGWTHRSNLFNERQVREVQSLAAFAESAPSQGEATVFAVLNVHNHPNRLSPTIFQIQEEEKVSIIAHERHARRPYEPGPLVETGAAPASGGKESKDESEEETSEVSLPEPPPPPGLPPVWLRISGLSPERIAAIAESGILESRDTPSTESSGELWTLVKNQNGLAGWALHGRLKMLIPDQVAQYSEGARITSYFALAPANKEGDQHHWLWTTLKTSNVAYDFDSFRVFTWNNRLRRFETSLIARDVEGYLPVEVFRTEAGDPRFRITLRERGGLIFRRTYELNGVRTRLVQSVPWPNYDPLRQPKIMDRLPAQPTRILPNLPGNVSFWEKTKAEIGSFFGRIFGR